MSEKKSWIAELSHFLSETFEVLIAHSDAEVQKIKKKIVYYIVIYGLFSAALFFILLGLVKFLADMNFFPSEGIGLMIMGSIIIVGLAAYSLIKKI